jgi:hypothetical protein
VDSQGKAMKDPAPKLKPGDMSSDLFDLLLKDTRLSGPTLIPALKDVMVGALTVKEAGIKHQVNVDGIYKGIRVMESRHHFALLASQLIAPDDDAPEAPLSDEQKALRRAQEALRQEGYGTLPMDSPKDVLRSLESLTASATSKLSFVALVKRLLAGE